ncbi:MAG: Re/Si-specific NAD(P)(+) transhydrogenase subunit alpha [Leptospiraceae bacterium]|nr:Re/Si-specific NAD(P)(+) transhydrogenase subunit alpha [Leptospiraceae bacterium]
MNIGIPKEIAPGETRVAIIPETVARLIKKGHTIQFEKDAGLASGFTNADYEKEGATLVPDASTLYANVDLLVKVQRPLAHPAGKHELEMMKKGALLAGFFYGLTYPDAAKKAAEQGVDVISMDAIPRTTKAQRMDALSSQTNLAGYKAVIIGANGLGKIFPLMMTAAGTISPARVVILGAGVAGLQAIATAKRLGAVVEVSDVRPEVKEQVESLGGRYIEPPREEGEDSADLSGGGGYAREATPEYLKKQQELLAKHIAEADVVVTTANVPGRKAPMLVSAAMVASMAPGSVIVDMAAESGGNCELTRAGEVVDHNGVKIHGVVNLPAQTPYHASQLYSRNLQALIDYITKEGQLQLDLEDEIVQGALLVHQGAVIHPKVKELLG